MKTSFQIAITRSKSSRRSSRRSARGPASPISARSRSRTRPNKKCVELKSLKFYLQSFRNQGIFYEHVTNTILDDLVGVIEPRWMKIEAAFNARGGMTETVTANIRCSLN